jgi:hypothetical protein
MSSSRRARAPRFVAVAAALAVALPAGAAQRMPASAPSRVPAAKPAAVPAPVRAPAATPAPSVLEPEPTLAAEPVDGGWRIGSALGFEFGMGDWEYDSVKVRIDAQRTIQQLSPVSTLSFVGSLSVAHPAGTKTVPVVIDPFSGIVQSETLEWDANVFELVPAARVTYVATPRVSLYADGGLGLVYTAARTYLPPAAAGLKTDLVEDGVGGVLRIAGGLVFTPSPALRVGVEVIGLHLRFGDGPGTGFALAASVSHRL